MNKITKGINALGILLRKPYLLNLVLNDNEQWKSYINKHYPGFRNLPSLTLVDLFGDINDAIEPYTYLDGGSLPTDLLLLKKLSARFDKCRYFEIGTWRGESAANVAAIAAECVTMDLPDEEKRKLGMSDFYISQHGILSRPLSNIEHIKANTLTFDFKRLNRKFDLVFIDGDHQYRSVRHDTQKIFRHLLHENSIVVWHDCAFNPEKTRYEVLAGILDGLPDEHQSKLFFIENTLCAVYLPGNIPETCGKKLTFRLTIQAGTTP
jgi:predicted O-methyltransferase YrrM